MQAEQRLQPVMVEDIVNTDVVSVEPDTTVSAVVSEMAEEDIGSVVVVDDKNPVGIVTERNIALTETPDLSERPVKEIIGDGELITATPQMTIFDAIRRLDDANIRRLSIVDDEGHLEGILSLDDIIVLLGTELNNVAEIIKAQTPRF